MKKDLPMDEDLRVILKPIFGIKPGIYLLGIYSLLLAAGAYWLFLEPGIHRPGSLTTFISEPPGAAVFTMDLQGKERYWGPTPVTAFLPEGTYSLELRKNRFSTHVQPLNVGNRLFFSRFLPETLLVNARLKEGDLAGIKSDFDRELTEWAMLGPSMGEYAYPSLFSTIRRQENWVGVSHPLPPLFTQLREDWLAAGASGPDLESFLTRRLHWVADPILYRNLYEALGGDAAGYAFSAQLDFWKKLVPEALGLASWVLINQPYKDRSTLAGSGDFRKALEEITAAGTKSGPRGAAPAARVLSGMEFLGVPGGSFLLGTPGRLSLEPPFEGSRPVEVTPFLLGRTEVTNGEFARFTRARQEWDPARRETLVAEGLADRSYLAHWNGSSPVPGDENKPVTGVSWFAAAAFAAWVEGQNPGFQVSLPREEEWEWSATDGGTSQDWSGENLNRSLKDARDGTLSGPGFRGLSGQVWEWTASDAAPAATLVGYGSEAHEPLEVSRKKTLRGGSFAGPRVLAQQVRGFHKAEWCTPYTGFRLMAREK